MRHAFATRLVEGGANIRAVQELLGHTDLKTTAVYLGVVPKHLEEAIRILDYSTKSSELNTSTVAPRLIPTQAEGRTDSTTPHVPLFPSYDPWVTALQGMLDPANLCQALESEKVEEVRLNQLPVIDKDAADRLRGLIQNDARRRKH